MMKITHPRTLVLLTIGWLPSGSRAMELTDPSLSPQFTGTKTVEAGSPVTPEKPSDSWRWWQYLTCCILTYASAPKKINQTNDQGQTDDEKEESPDQKVVEATNATYNRLPKVLKHLIRNYAEIGIDAFERITEADADGIAQLNADYVKNLHQPRIENLSECFTACDKEFKLLEPLDLKAKFSWIQHGKANNLLARIVETLMLVGSESCFRKWSNGMEESKSEDHHPLPSLYSVFSRLQNETERQEDELAKDKFEEIIEMISHEDSRATLLFKPYTNLIKLGRKVREYLTTLKPREVDGRLRNQTREAVKNMNYMAKIEDILEEHNVNAAGEAVAVNW